MPSEEGERIVEVVMVHNLVIINSYFNKRV